MATGTQIPVELYLRSSEYEPDAEYVDGEILERPMGEIPHADWQQAIQRWFANHAEEWHLRAYSELRVQVGANFRIPDVTVVDRSVPESRYITHPPIAVFEILSPEDTVSGLRKKLAEYAQMGIPQIWVVHPETAPAHGSFERYQDGSLTPSMRFEQGPIHFDLPEIAALLQG